MATDNLSALDALIAEASAEVQAYACPFTRQRYLSAHYNDAKAALKGIQDTVAWRASAIVDGFSCALCAQKPGAHCFISLGQDSEGAAIIYGCPARAASGGEVALTVAHCVNCLEKQWGAAPAAPQTWVWVVDFRGFGISHSLQARLGISFATIFKAHFPERLKAILLLNPPSLFKLLVAAIGAIADARTLAKLKVVEAPGPEELCAKLRDLKIENAEVLSWLQQAFTDPPVPGTLPPLPPHVQHLQV